ncbi:MAG: carbohydrate ABC transporter permease [Clostridiales bacterium]|nr:carbohydrate ABC transporter permease [Clostridiales bacterium]
MKKTKFNKIVTLIPSYLAIATYIIFLVFPLLWMLSVSVRPEAELTRLEPSFIPETVILEHYATVFSGPKMIQSILNSIKVGAMATVGVIALAIPAAYALGRYSTRINKYVIGWVLVSQLFPTILIMIALLMILIRLGLTNSHFGLALVYMVWTLPFVLLMLQSYIKAIPQELEDAAAIDGATRTQTIMAIVLPLLLPGIAATALFAFVSAWNEFFFALVLLREPELVTLPVMLARLVGREGVARLGPLAAASFIATIPALVLFGFLQKWLTSGLLSGSVK